jgi:hypothetical protein
MALTAIGTSCRFSSRCSDVTIISSIAEKDGIAVSIPISPVKKIVILVVGFMFRSFGAMKL